MNPMGSRVAAVLAVLGVAAMCLAQETRPASRSSLTPEQSLLYRAAAKHTMEQAELLPQQIKDKEAQLRAIRGAAVLKSIPDNEVQRTTDGRGRPVYKFGSHKKKDELLTATKSEVETLKGSLESIQTGGMVVPPMWISGGKVGDAGLFNANLRIVQVLGPDKALVSNGREETMAILEGVSTAGWVDDRTIRLTELLAIPGTTTYNSAVGTNTVLRVVKVPPFKLER